MDIAWRPILLVGLEMVLCYMVDTAASTWGPSLGEKTFDGTTDTAAIGTLLYLIASVSSRPSPRGSPAPALGLIPLGLIPLGPIPGQGPRR